MKKQLFKTITIAAAAWMHCQAGLGQQLIKKAECVEVKDGQPAIEVGVVLYNAMNIANFHKTVRYISLDGGRTLMPAQGEFTFAASGVLNVETLTYTHDPSTNITVVTTTTLEALNPGWVALPVIMTESVVTYEANDEIERIETVTHLMCSEVRI